MHVPVGNIAGQWWDYKRCVTCFAVNWYEAEACHDCHETAFRELTEKEELQLLADSECEECEIDV